MSDFPNPPEARLMRIGRGLRSTLDGAVSDEAKGAAFERFQSAFQSAQRRRQRVRQCLGGGALVATLVFGGFLSWPDPALTFHASAESAGGYIRVGGQQPSTVVNFSDGTQLVVHPESQARIADVTAKGARLALEGGRVHLKVARKPGAEWSVEAGPYRILVTGTEFDVNWRTTSDLLEVELQEGAVRVEGPLTREGIRVAAGERLTANLRTSELRLASLTPEPSAARAEAPAPTPPKLQLSPPSPPQTVGRSASATASPVAAASPARRASDWSQLMAKSQYRAVVADAQQRGLEAVLSSVSVTELVMLGDAARYAGQPAVAGRALLSVRERFPGGKQAGAAAFMLGRLAEDHLGDTRTALTWYTTYLQESPSGTFASEALGRKMGVVSKTRGRAAAASLAEAYLQRYPGGPYATAAHRILTP